VRDSAIFSNAGSSYNQTNRLFLPIADIGVQGRTFGIKSKSVLKTTKDTKGTKEVFWLKDYAVPRFSNYGNSGDYGSYGNFSGPAAMTSDLSRRAVDHGDSPGRDPLSALGGSPCDLSCCLGLLSEEIFSVPQCLRGGLVFAFPITRSRRSRATCPGVPWITAILQAVTRSVPSEVLRAICLVVWVYFRRRFSQCLSVSVVDLCLLSDHQITAITSDHPMGSGRCPSGRAFQRTPD
jgi:hypothetical protein